MSFSYKEPSEFTNTWDFQNNVAELEEFDSLNKYQDFMEHQIFVQRYLSPYTPYNTLLLFHEVGSGKSGCVAAL